MIASSAVPTPINGYSFGGSDTVAAEVTFRKRVVEMSTKPRNRQFRHISHDDLNEHIIVILYQMLLSSHTIR
jgi:hypothetical protein